MYSTSPWNFYFRSLLSTLENLNEMILEFCRIYSLILYFQYTRVNGKFLGGTVSWRLLGSKVSFLGNCINDLHISEKSFWS